MNISEVITKRLDSIPFCRWHVGMILAIGTIWIFDGYEVSLVSLLSKYILEDHSQTQYKSLATMYQFGCIIGSLCFSVFTYYYGRKAVFMITLLIYAVGVICCLLGQIFTLFMVGRFLTGISVGGQFTAIFTAVDEFLPPSVRGRVDIIIDGTWHLGGCISSILNLTLGEIKWWRYFFSLGFFGILGLACIRKNVPESPRWLVMKKRYQEAQNIVSAIQYSSLNKHFFVQPVIQQNPEQIKVSPTQSDRKVCNKKKSSDEDELEKSQNQISNEQVQQQQTTTTDQKTIFKQIKLIFFQYKLRFLVSCILIYVQAFFFSSLYYQYPVLLTIQFDFSQRQISAYMLGLAICSFVSTLLVGPFFDILGRKKMLLLTYGMTGLLLPLSTFFMESSMELELLTCFIFLFGSPAASSANLIASEIFPTSTRPIILSIIFLVGMGGAICGVWVNNYYISAGLMLIGGICGFLFSPQSENKSLEQINNLNENINK